MNRIAIEAQRGRYGSAVVLLLRRGPGSVRKVDLGPLPCSPRRRWAVCPWDGLQHGGIAQRCRYHSMYAGDAMLGYRTSGWFAGWIRCAEPCPVQAKAPPATKKAAKMHIDGSSKESCGKRGVFIRRCAILRPFLTRISMGNTQRRKASFWKAGPTTTLEKRRSSQSINPSQRPHSPRIIDINVAGRGGARGPI